MLAARLMEAAGRWPDTFQAVREAVRHQPPNLWTLRQLVGHAMERGESALAAEAHHGLAERTADPMEQATLLLRAAEARLAAGEDDAARELLGGAFELWPDHYVVRLQRAHLLERTGNVAEAAAAFEQLAMVCQAPAERAASLYRAATLWLSLDDQAGRDEGRRLLEAVAAIDPDHEDTFERLKAIYLASGAKNELADLLDARLQRVEDPAQRIELEVLRGRVLAEAGAAAEARAALEAAIQANPDNPAALSAFADVCAAEQDWPAVEQALIGLGRLVSDPAGQADIYVRLGNLYSDHVPNPERAELAYQEVLKHVPEQGEARRKLVDLYLQGGDVTRAFEQQKALIDASKSPKEQCTHVVRLAEIYETAGDLKQAEATLVKARRTFSKEHAAMTALYHFYRRNGQDPAADKLLERAAAEVRRGLGAGRFEPALFGMVVAVAELRGQPETAEIAAATLAAIEGEVTTLEGFGLAAGGAQLDPYLAPDIFSEPFRALLRSTGSLLELAVPLDLGALRAKPLSDTHAELAEITVELATAYGVPDVQLFSSNALGPICIPACTEPPAILFGVPLLEVDQYEPREFLIHRALKLLQTRTAALARTAPIDLWPLIAAFLKLHSPSFSPQGVDPRRFEQYHKVMSERAPAPDPRTSTAAGEVIGGIGNRASSLNTVAASWGSRTALLAMGDPYVALLGVAWALGTPQGPPPAGPDRVKWISRKAEARDLIVFSVSDVYAQARQLLRSG
jgi:tetratricopeptide (TPR) repeat protein